MLLTFTDGTQFEYEIFFNFLFKNKLFKKYIHLRIKCNFLMREFNCDIRKLKVPLIENNEYLRLK